jgi:16S rRNA (guanine527-N7)-methyltransferase
MTLNEDVKRQGTREMSQEISKAQVEMVLAPYGIQLSGEQIEKTLAYVRLLVKWNRHMSLTTITDPAEVVGRHFGESMFASKLISVENCRLADVGTGAGFPGLALKIVRPNLQLSLIESNAKKCVFLSEVVRALDLSNVEVRTTRFEDLRPPDGFANFVTARAVGGYSDLLRWAKTALIPQGNVVLWVGGEDITRIANSKGWIWDPPSRIPESQRRFLLIGRRFGEVREIEGAEAHS